MRAMTWAKRGAGLLAMAFLAGCAMGPRLDAPSRAPALEVLALDFERTAFDSGSRVSGSLARKQRDLRLSWPTSGMLRQAGTGPIPTEVLVRVDRLSTSGGRVTMAGTLILRDLGLGTVLAQKDDFSATGALPLVARGGRFEGLVFRGVEAEIVDWIAGLECDTDARRCGPPLTVPGVDGGTSEDADIDLVGLVDRRPGGLRKLVGGAIDPNKILAAAEPAPVSEDAAAGSTRLGETVAALGLLDRSGFWLKTPLVSTETPGEIARKGSDQRISVTLIPKDGPAGGGSQISLAAITALGADMTALLTLEVFR